jgi:predicted aspartyl protease
MTLAIGAGVQAHAAASAQPTLTHRGGVNGHIVLLPVVVNGQGPFDFALDTGAPTTVVEPAFAKRAGLERLANADAIGAAGPTSASAARVESLAVGDARVTSMRIGVVDKFSALRAISPTVVGSLGNDFLHHFVVDVDYAHETIVCRNPSGTEDRDDAIPFVEQRLLFVKAFVNGKGPFDFAVDTGAEVSIVSPDLVTELELLTRPAPALTGVGGASPAIEARATTLDTLDVSGRHYAGFDVAVASFFDPLRAVVGIPFRGVLGYQFFAGKTVRFDFPRHKLSMSP